MRTSTFVYNRSNAESRVSRTPFRNDEKSGRAEVGKKNRRRRRKEEKKNQGGESRTAQESGRVEGGRVVESEE